MPRSALLAPMLTMSALAGSVFLLAGCSGSGFWRYEHDTFTLPGANPNRPAGSAENFQRVRHATLTDPAPLLTEAGDIWPAPGAPVPTLKDLQQRQSAELNANPNGAPTLAPLPPLPSLPGYEISPQDVTTPAPTQVFPGSIPTRNGRLPIQGEQGYKAPAESGNRNIVVPNGNGTSTVISPTGQVTTIPTPK